MCIIEATEGEIQRHYSVLRRVTIQTLVRSPRSSSPRPRDHLKFKASLNLSRRTETSLDAGEHHILKI